MTFKDVTNEELIELYKKQASSMSFFNAAGGQAYYSEATARGICGVEFRKIKEEFVARGLELPKGSWLI